MSTEELAKELPFSEASERKPWDTPTLAFKRQIREKAAAVAKKKGKNLAKKDLEWKTWRTRDGTDPETPCCAPILLFDVQKLLTKTGMEFHWPGYQYTGPGTHLEKRLVRGDPGINRLDRIAKAHDIDYGKAKDLKDKWAADRKMIGKCNSPAAKP